MGTASPSEKVSWLLWTVLTILVAGAVIGLFFFYGSLTDSAKREAFVAEGAKALLTLLTVGVVGVIVKLLVDDRSYALKKSDEERLQAEQRQYAERVRADEKEERLQAFRTDKIRRLAEVTNVLRRAPTLIAANRSAKTYNEQMRLVINAGLELRLIRHETNAIGDEDNLAFTKWPEICEKVRLMETYIERLAEEWRGHSKELSEKQRLAENDQLQPDQRRQKQSDIWLSISALPSVADLLEERGGRGPKTRFATEFIEPYNSAIGMMISSSLETNRRAGVGAAAPIS